MLDIEYSVIINDVIKIFDCSCFMFQVMDPGSSLVRHMSMKAGGTKRTSLDRDARSVMAVGKDNKGYDNTTDTHENLKVL